MATSVISNVYLSCVLCARCCQCLWLVHSWWPLQLSLTFVCPVSKQDTGQINVRDNWKGHHEWTSQRHWQHRTHKTQDKYTLEITEVTIKNGQALSIHDGHFSYLLRVFVLCLVCPVLPVSLACPFLMATSVISNVYLSCVVRDNWSGHHEWTSQRHWQHRTHKTHDK
jgi:hypothetical protein